MSVTVNLTNVQVNGDMIEGDLVLDVDVGNIKFNKSQHVKTIKDVQQTYNLGDGITLTVVGTLKADRHACVSGTVSKSIFGLPVSVPIPLVCAAY